MSEKIKKIEETSSITDKDNQMN